MDMRKLVGENLKRIRQARGLTQEQLAELSGFSQQYISGLELGILQVRIRPARPARKGRNPATGEEIRIKASKASKRVAFRVAKALKEAI